MNAHDATAGIRIGFGETDYVANERDLQARIILTKLESTTEDVTVAVRLVTFEEFQLLNRTLPSTITEAIIPDPAECELIKSS